MRKAKLLSTFVGLLLLVGPLFAQAQHRVATDQSAQKSGTSAPPENPQPDQQSASDQHRVADDRAETSGVKQHVAATDLKESEKRQKLAQVKIAITNDSKPFKDGWYDARKNNVPKGSPAYQAIETEQQKAIERLENNVRWISNSVNRGSSEAYKAEVRQTLADLAQQLQTEHGYIKELKRLVNNILIDLPKMKGDINALQRGQQRLEQDVAEIDDRTSDAKGRPIFSRDLLNRNKDQDRGIAQLKTVVVGTWLFGLSVHTWLWILLVLVTISFAFLYFVIRRTNRR